MSENMKMGPSKAAAILPVRHSIAAMNAYSCANLFFATVLPPRHLHRRCYCSFFHVLHMFVIRNTLLSQNQETPAHAAAYCGHVDILRTLHQHSAKLNTKNKVSFVC